MRGYRHAQILVITSDSSFGQIKPKIMMAAVNIKAGARKEGL